jgi:hypothetical protein
MALTWGTLMAGAAVLFALPVAVIWLNVRKRNAGWWLLLAIVALVIIGGIAEKAVAAS